MTSGQQLDRSARVLKSAGENIDAYIDECIGSRRINGGGEQKASDSQNKGINSDGGGKQKTSDSQNKGINSDNMSGQKRKPEAAEQALGMEAPPARNNFDVKDWYSLETKRCRRIDEPPALSAKYHPDFHHVVNTPRVAGGFLTSSAVGLTSQMSFHHQTQMYARPHTDPEVTIQEHLMASGMTGGMSNFSLSRQNARPPTMPLHSISNVAVRSLSATAKSVGITLDQLALALSTNKNLMSLLSGISSDDNTNGDSQKKYELALRLHEYETKTLHSRCMLLAGYTHEESRKGGPTHLCFALEAWQNEGKRLQESFRNSLNSVDDSTEHQYKSAPSNVDPERGLRHLDPSETRRHIHTLEGKCGHQAVLHRPKGGRPHIDFVVGDKVECYGDVQLAPNMPPDQWPSQYLSDELACADGEADQCPKLLAEGLRFVPGDERTTSTTTRQLDESSLYLRSSEWITDFDDDVLMSFYKSFDHRQSRMITDQTLLAMTTDSDLSCQNKKSTN